MTMHDEVAERLSEYLDDELSGDERQLVEGHLAECARCRQTLEDLRHIVATARTLPAIEPETDLWRGIAARIATGPRALPRPARRFAFTLPQLAAAAVLLAVLSGALALSVARRNPTVAPAPGDPSGRGTTAQVRPNQGNAGVDGRGATGADVDAQLRPASFEDPQYDAAVKDLVQAVERGRDKLDPTTVAAVEQDLKIIDAAVADAQKALAADPSNGYLSGYLVETRQRKLTLLRQAAALSQDVM